MPFFYLCPSCGRRVEVPDDYPRLKIRCPTCGVIGELPDPVARKASAPRTEAETAPAPSQRRAPVEDWQYAPRAPEAAAAPAVEYSDEDDGKPYRPTDPERPRCPQCSSALDFGAVLCMKCGFDQSSGKKAVQTYQPLARRWESGWPYAKRLGFFLLCQGPAILLGALGTWVTDSVTAFVVSWPLFALLTAFLLGSFDRLELVRNARGKVVLTRTWRICFWELEPTTIHPRQFESVVTGREHEAGFFEWVVFFVLLPGVVSALVWWWIAIRQVTFYVCLSRDHGYPAETLYRGWNEAQMQEIAAAVSDAARLPYTRG